MSNNSPFEQITGFDVDGNIRYDDHSDDGLFPLLKREGKYVSEQGTCRHPEHNPPSHMAIPEGHGYQHTCPWCGHVQVIKNDGPTFRG